MGGTEDERWLLLAEGCFACALVPMQTLSAKIAGWRGLPDALVAVRYGFVEWAGRALVGSTQGSIGCSSGLRDGNDRGVGG